MKQIEMSGEDRMLIDEMLAARRRLDLQDKAFHAVYLPGDYWTWLNAQTCGVSRKVINGYRAVMPHILADVDATAKVRARISTPTAIADFVPTKYTRLVERVVATAVRGDADLIGAPGCKQKRIVLVLGVTDSGKTALRDRLAMLHGAPIVRCTESCRTNASSIHTEIQVAHGALRPWGTRRARELATYRLLNSDKPKVILYDESLRLGPAACNVIADINDHTNAVQVLFGLPELVDKLAGKGWAEGSQMLSRVLETVTLADLDPADVRPLLAPLGLNGATDLVAKDLAAVANEYGRFGFVRRVLASISRYRAHTVEEICGNLNLPREERSGIIPDERENLRIQRTTERLREVQERRNRTRHLRAARKSEVAS
jgi:DNA transposition AAA+ family ATPase